MSKNNPSFQFYIDKKKKAIYVKKEWTSSIKKVWNSWTQPELLDQWWAPKPYYANTKIMDFTTDGFWLYAMVSPTDEKHWSRVDYLEIEPLKYFITLDSFCDENGVINREYPRSQWTHEFVEQSGLTTVFITIEFDTLSDLETVVEMGFKKGFTMGLSNLDLLLAQ